MTSISDHAQGSPVAQGFPVAQGSRPPLWAPWYGIGFGHAVARFWRKAFIVHGRASRSEYWWACLFQSLILVALTVAGVLIDSSLFGVDSDATPVADTLTILWGVITIVPDLSVSIRRLHDENLRGWWVLLSYALELVALVMLIAGVAVGVVSKNAGASVWWFIAAVACYLLGEVVSVVLMVLPSRPQGTRFDRPPVPTGVQTATGGMLGMDAAVTTMPSRDGQTALSQPASMPICPGAPARRTSDETPSASELSQPELSQPEPWQDETR